MRRFFLQILPAVLGLCAGCSSSSRQAAELADAVFVDTVFYRNGVTFSFYFTYAADSKGAFVERFLHKEDLMVADDQYSSDRLFGEPCKILKPSYAIEQDYIATSIPVITADNVRKTISDTLFFSKIGMQPAEFHARLAEMSSFTSTSVDTSFSSCGARFNVRLETRSLDSTEVIVPHKWYTSDLTKSDLRFRDNEIVATLSRSGEVLERRRIRKENLEKYPTPADNLNFEAELHSELLSDPYVKVTDSVCVVLSRLGIPLSDYGVDAEIARFDLSLRRAQAADTIKIVSGDPCLYYPFGQFKSIDLFFEALKGQCEGLAVRIVKHGDTDSYVITDGKDVSVEVLLWPETNYVEIVHARFMSPNVKYNSGLCVGMPRDEVFALFRLPVGSHSSCLRVESELLGIVMSVSFSPDGRVALIAVESDYVLDV